MPQDPYTSLPSAPALERGLAIIEALCRVGHPLSFGELQRSLDMPKSTLIRLLAVLRHLGYLDRDGEGHRPGPRLERLRAPAQLGERLRAAAAHYLDQLSEACGNTAILFQVEGETTIAIEKSLHEAAVTMREPGSVATAEWDSPWGWILLAEIDEDRCKVLANRVRPSRELRGIVRRAIATYRKQGWLLDDGLGIPLVRRLALPMRGENDELIAILALGGNPLTMPDSRIDDFVDALQHTSKRILKRLRGERSWG